MTEIAAVSTDACAVATIHAIDTETADVMAGMLKALADPLRLRILSTIAGDARGETCVCDFTGLADVSQPTISHHLKVLKDAGVLISERRGTWVWYCIAPSRSGVVALLLNEFASAVTEEILV